MKEICSLFFFIYIFTLLYLEKKRKRKVSNAAFLPCVQGADDLGEKMKGISLDRLIPSKHCSFA